MVESLDVHRTRLQRDRALRTRRVFSESSNLSEPSPRSDESTSRVAAPLKRMRRIPISARWNRLRASRKNSVFSLALLALFHGVLYFQFTAPDNRLPSLLQHLVAFADAAFVAAVISLALEDWRLVRRQATMDPATETAGGTKFGVASIVGFVLTLSLWLSPWAPIKIAAERVATDSPDQTPFVRSAR